MNKSIRFILLLATTLFAVQALLAAEPVNYYNNAKGKSDETLMTALRNIIRTHKEVSYSSGLLNAFAIADVDDEGYIIDIYSNCRYRPSDNGSSASHVGEGYNREHSFPRSWFGGEVAPMNTDVFHVYPTDIRVNSQRGNHPYGVCQNGTRLTYGSYVAKGKLGGSTYPGYTGTVFEPDDEYKGDLARTYFYMVTCYKNELPSWPGSPNLDYRTNNYKAFSTWTINMLMEWTRLDPVSEKEIKRNEAVYGIQRNRNPFIDHPELAEYIWGDKQGQPWGEDDSQPRITAPQNGLVFDMGTCTVDEQLEYKIYLEGKNLTEDLTLTFSDSENFSVYPSTFPASKINNGTMLTVTFKPIAEGTFYNEMTLSSSEASTSFKVFATATKKDEPNPPVELGDSIMEDWEDCETGGYWNKQIEGNAWTWDFTDAGIWGDNLKHGELSCRLGKTSSSSIAMAEDVVGNVGAISFWAGCFGNDPDANLRVDYSTDQGATWLELGDFTFKKGFLQHITMEVIANGTVRFRIVQTSGLRVNIDDITLYKRIEGPIPPPPTIKGDVNRDGEVTVADVNAVILFILNATRDAEAELPADVNCDGEVTIADINMIISIIIGGA